jgi:phosphatidylinositol glycan class P protein
LTLALGNVETVVDEAAMVAVVDGRGRIVRGDRERRRREGARRARGGREGPGSKGRSTRERDAGAGPRVLNWREVWNEGTDAVMDVPLAGVCEVLYGEGRDWDSEVEEGEGVITRV